MTRPTWAGVAVLLLLGLQATYVANRLEFTTGLAHLMPDSEDRAVELVIGRFVDSPLNRTMVLAVSASDPVRARTALRRWAPELEAHSEVAELRTGPEEGFGEALYDIYFPHRYRFLSHAPEKELPPRLSTEGLQKAAARLRRELASPQTDLVKALAPNDPLLAFLDLAREFERGARGGLLVVDGQFAIAGEPTALAFLVTHHSPFDAGAQAPFEQFLKESFERLAEGDPGLRLERSAVHRFAVASERTARADMTRISTISLGGIVLLFALVFRSLRLLAICLVPLAAGLLMATSVGLLLFGSLHVMTAAFGATLIGVCIDYPVHLASHHVVDPSSSGPRGPGSSVWGAIGVGALTTAVGFLGMTLADLPAVREIGVFSASGVLGALLTTRFLVPDLLPTPTPPARGQERAAVALDGILSRMARRKRGLAWLLGAALVVSLLGLARMQFEDDVYALSLPPDPLQLEEDRRVRQLVSRMDAGMFVVAFGDDEEEALRRNDAVYQRLAEARAARELAGFRSLHPYLFSRELQRRNLDTVRGTAGLEARMRSALEREGFRPEAFRAFDGALAAMPPEPLTFADLVHSPLGDLVGRHRVDVGDQVAIVTFLRNVARPAALAQRLADIPGTHYVDQQDLLRRVYRGIRARAVAVTAAGLLAVLVVLAVRYRSASAAGVVLVPAVVAAAATLALLSFAGVRINLLHLLGLLMVLSIGVDYAVFLLAEPEPSRARAATAFSLVVACASTVLAFGLLALSSFPALRPLGVTTGLGVLLSLVLAPTSVLLARAGRR